MKTIKSLPPYEYLHECFAYDPQSGQLKWKKRPRHHFPFVGTMDYFNKMHAGNLTGVVQHKRKGAVTGLYLCLNSENYPAHRIIFKLMTGRDPIGLIDHINRDPTDNRWNNLREATTSQNNINSKVYSTSTTRVKGVTFCKDKGKYKVRIMHNGASIHLGYFDSVTDAANAYSAKARELFGEYYPEHTPHTPQVF